MGAQKMPKFSLLFRDEFLQSVRRRCLGGWPLAFGGVAVLAAAGGAFAAVVAVTDNERVPLRIIHRHVLLADGIERLLRRDELDGAGKVAPV